MRNANSFDPKLLSSQKFGLAHCAHWRLAVMYIRAPLGSRRRVAEFLAEEQMATFCLVARLLPEILLVTKQQ